MQLRVRQRHLSIWTPHGPEAIHTAHQHLCMPKVSVLPLGLGWDLCPGTRHPCRKGGRLPRAGTSSLVLRAELLVLLCPKTASLLPSGLSGASWCQLLPTPSPAPALGIPLQTTALVAQTHLPPLPLGLVRGCKAAHCHHSSCEKPPHAPEHPALPLQHQPPAITLQPPKVVAPLTGTAENRCVQLSQVTKQQISLSH